MKAFFLSAVFCCLAVICFAQLPQRIPISSIIPGEQTGQDYTPWLNDNTDSLVADAWQGNMKYVDVTLRLSAKSLISQLRFYDYTGVFTTNPAYIYVLNGNQKSYIGKFEGLTYQTWVTLQLQHPLVGDAILIHKYSNNIPQKVQVYGEPYTSTTVVPETRIFYESVTPRENTGQDYNQWLNDNLDSTIGWGNANSFQYIDVGIKLQQRSRIRRLSFWDTEGVFTTHPAYFYAVKDTQKTFLGSFVGDTYHSWVDLVLPAEVTADSILVRKYSRYIPQKINTYGTPLLQDPIDTLVPPDGRLPITSIHPLHGHGMDFSAWLNDNLDSLVVPSYIASNFTYSDVSVHLEGKSKIGRLSLYDEAGDFSHMPAYVYAVYHTDTTYIGTFLGNTYQTFVDLSPADSVIASSILIRKYSNYVPQKVKIYGRLLVAEPDTATDTDTDTTITEEPVPLAKIPIDPHRWFHFNNVREVAGQLFDGDTVKNVNGGHGTVLQNYEAVYPLKEGEQMDIAGIRFYDGEGMLGDAHKLTVSVINDQGQKIPVGSFNGDRYLQWVGPYPGRQRAEGDKFRLDSVIHNVRYLVLNIWFMYPTEIELLGTYVAPPPVQATPPIAKQVRFRDMTGVNAFEWNFESPYDPMKLDPARYAGVKNFGAVRHYMDWHKLEGNQGKYTYAPTHSGGWNYDTIYRQCKADGIFMLGCLKTQPEWMQATYPADIRDAENIPVPYGADITRPQAYLLQAKAAFQYAARYGSNTLVDPSLVTVNSQPRWNFDDINQVRIGLNTVKYIECDNERDKWWKGRKAYQTSYEYAANLSAFYDGHLNTMGPGVGVKNADPNMQVVMGGLAAPDPSYVKGMIEWCRVNRGYKPDGTVNLCWDVLNYHCYSGDVGSSQGGYSTRGAAPEKSDATEVARAFRKMAHEEVGDMPIWVTEVGYDENQYSPFKAIAIGNKSVRQTVADWNLRSALLYAREGIEKVFFYQLYDDNPLAPIQFGSMGFLNDDLTRRPVTDYLVQVNKLIGNYTYQETLGRDPLVDRYELDGKSIYALMIPDEIGRTGSYTLQLGNVDSVKVCTPLAGSDTMRIEYLPTRQGAVTIPVSETPVFVVPIYPAPTAIPQYTFTTEQPTRNRTARPYRLNKTTRRHSATMSFAKL